MKRLVAAIAFAGLAACTPQPAAEAAPAGAAARHPISGLPIVPLSVTTPQGTHKFRVEVAATAQTLGGGLKGAANEVVDLVPLFESFELGA